ncbi:MAG: GspH/FimT family pseudopilin [Rhodoblastus sp.]|nr:MAG: GspH/FimT family pseudopilin [Rhodoblastus sp.]
MKQRLHRQRGFTLVETLAILAVLALVAAVSTPLLRPPSDGLVLRRAAHEMAAALRATRARAILRNEEADFAIDLARNVYSASSLSETSLPAGTTLSLVVAKLERAAVEAARDPRQAVRFYPDGTSSGAAIELKLRRAAAAVNVNWLTGQASASP